MKGKWGVDKLANNNDLLSSLSASNSPLLFEPGKRNGSLYWHWAWTGEPDLQFLPESATKFFSASKEYDYQFDFTLDNSGKVTNAYFIRNGVKMLMKKAP